MHCLFIFQAPASIFFTVLDRNEVDASANFFKSEQVTLQDIFDYLEFSAIFNFFFYNEL